MTRSGRLLCVVLAGILCAGLARATAAAPDDQPRVLVVPFENVTHDTRIFWLGEASAVALTDNLNALGVSAIRRAQRREAFGRLQVPPAAALTDATVIRIGQLVGATQVIVGTVELSDNVLIVHARQIVLETGKVQANAVERGPMPDLLAIFDRLARRFAGSGAAVPPGGLQHPPVGAFESYVKGLVAETPATEIKYLDQAVALDPRYDRARLALWEVYDDQGAHERALAAAVGVQPESAFYGRAQFMAGMSELKLKRYDDAFATFQLLVQARPTARAVNNLGVIQLRRGAIEDTEPATSYFKKATELDPNDADYFFNLGYAYWEERNGEEAVHWLREAVRRDPADADAHLVLGAALDATGSRLEAGREQELARRLSSTYEAAARRSGADPPVPKGLERVKSDVELPHGWNLDATLAKDEQREQEDLARFYLDRARRLYDRENDRAALEELNRAIYLSPYLADAHLLVGRIHLRGGRVHDAIDAFKIAIWSHETAEAHVALGQAYLEDKNPDEARAEAQRALALDPESAAARRLLERIGGG
ncbi:MAG: tetratricopeptide repeat protein [Betaproteobacteria bacterium]